MDLRIIILIIAGTPFEALNSELKPRVVHLLTLPGAYGAAPVVLEDGLFLVTVTVREREGQVHRNRIWTLVSHVGVPSLSLGSSASDPASSHMHPEGSRLWPK